MHDDVFFQATSLLDPAAVAAWNRTQLGFLAHAAVTPEHLGAVLTLAPDFAHAHAIKGLFYLLLGRRELIAVAQEAHATANRLLEAATPRERLYVQALGDWLQGAPSRSVARLEEVLRAHPEDALAMKLSQAIRFVLGDAEGMRRSVERVMPAYAPDHPGRGYLLGCHAFALEETGDYTAAEIAGRQALWMASDDAWGLHAVAHVHDMTGNARAGLDWLAGREAAWAHCNNFRYHVWWHKALMHLDLGEVDHVLALYDHEIRKDKTDDYRDISNATSLLTRLELDGVDVGDRWDELADLSAARTEDGCLIFADLHYMLALSAGGRNQAMADMMRRIHQDAQSRPCDMGQRMADPGVAAANGLHAFGEGHYDTAFRHLLQARGSMQQAGGSHAQRDVFERLTIDAGIRAGYLDDAERVLNDRQSRRTGRDDGFAAARRSLIEAGRGGTPARTVPAE